MGKKSKKAYKKFLKSAACPANWAGADAAGAAQPNVGKKSGKGLWGALQGNTSQQFLLGAALGAAATYVMSNDELREKIIRSAVKLYSDLAGGVAELKEQMADMQAELQAKNPDHNE